METTSPEARENKSAASDSPGEGKHSWSSRGIDRVYCALMLAGVCLLVPVMLQWRSWLGGDLPNRYAPHPQWAGLLIPLFLAGMLLLVGLAGLLKSPDWASGHQRGKALVLLLFLILSLKFLLHVSVVMFLNEFSLAGAIWPSMQRLGDGAYNLAASQVSNCSDFLAGFERRFLESERDPLVPHLETHPPGPILFFYAIQVFLDAHPAFRGWLEESAVSFSPILEETLLPAARETQLFRHALPVGVLAAGICFLMAAMVPVLTYLVAREFSSTPVAFAMAVVSSLFPGSFLFSPGIDQLHGPLALLLCLFAIRAVKRKSAFYGLLLGLFAFISFGMSLAFVVPVGMLTGAGLLALVCAPKEQGGPETAPLSRLRSMTMPGLFAVAGLVIPVLVIAIVFRMNLIHVLALCYRNNANFHALDQRDYWPWALSNMVETLYSMGAPAFFTLCIVWCLAAVRIKTNGSAGLNAFFLGVHGCFLLLCLVAVNRGEVGRLWLFLFPVLWAAAAGPIEEWFTQVWRDLGSHRKLGLAGTAAFALQACYVLILSACIEPFETAKTFYNILQRFS